MKPKPPENRLICDICGDITETGKHKSFCRVIPWTIMLIPMACLVVFVLKIMRVIE